MGRVDLCTECKDTGLEVSTASMVLLESIGNWCRGDFLLFVCLLVCLFISVYGYPWRPEEGGGVPCNCKLPSWVLGTKL